jgi:Sec-independent protein translocase protein TatA
MMMGEERTLRKLKKLTGRLSARMEEMRDLMDDMEIEFEMMQKQIDRLEKRSGGAPAPTKAKKAKVEQSEDIIDDDDEDDIDMENTTTVFVKPKF